MKELPDELASIIESLERDEDLWKKVRAMNGARFNLECRCNSSRLQRAVIVQKRGMVRRMEAMKPNQGIPAEIKLILDMCRTNEHLIKQVDAFSTSRVNIVFECSGFGLESGQALMQET